MKTWTCLIAVGIASVASAQWYNGDPDRAHGGISAEFNTDVSDSFLFEDFDHPGGMVTGLFGNYLWELNLSGYVYEIRSGMSNGFGGTLHASGDTDGAYVASRNGFDGYGLIGYRLWADIVDVPLQPGTYMMALSVKGDGSGRAFVRSASGTNGYGSPVDNDHNWFHSGYFEVEYQEDPTGFDFSYGVNIPAPASVALLGFGGVVGIGRRHRFPLRTLGSQRRSRGMRVEQSQFPARGGRS